MWVYKVWESTLDVEKVGFQNKHKRCMFSMKCLILLTTLISVISAKPFFMVDEECKGYNACVPIDLNKINVHLIPHSHDDVGWLSTVDQYFFNQVETIISSVIGGLLQNEERRFIQVETAYFKKWWVEQPQLTKDLVRQLTNEGRLEFIGGGWSMNDEAAAHYMSTIDQFTLGLRYLVDNVGKCAKPKIGWQIDPFGHSREQASIFSQLGYDGFYFARLDYRDRDKRKRERNMDLLWTGSANLGSDSNIFTSAFENHYSAPNGFCFDIRCGDEMIVNDEESPEYNLEEKVNKFVETIKGVKDHYPTDNVLFTLGDDFRWEAAERSFNQLDKLIAGFKKFNPKLDDKEINIFYSTPSCYAKAVNEFATKKDIKLDVKTDDFLPYASSANRVWSGYYTSRPTSKHYERLSNNLLQISRQLSVLGGLPHGTLFNLESAMGYMQHHDAITGTEKTHVEKDYHRTLTKSVDEAIDANSQALTNILGLSNNIGLKTCPLANVSICAESNKDEFQVLLYNPLAKTTTQYVQIPVTGNNWEVTDPEGNSVEVVVSEPIRNFDYIAQATRNEIHENILIFKVDLPAVGYNVYNIKRGNSIHKTSIKKVTLKEDAKVGFDDKYVVLDGETGHVKQITINGVTADIEQEIKYYKGSDASGAYIFRPDSYDRDHHSFGKADVTILSNDGNVVREIKQVWNDWITQIVRIYKDENFVEFDYAVGPINLDAGDNGTEVVLTYTSNIANDGVFYTDSNGREMIYRKKDFRPTYDYSNEEPQAGNYYPINTRIAIEDDQTRLAVITDRSHGGASLNEGQIEIMVNRALSHDDGFGVGEALNEQEFDRGLVSRGSNYLTIGASKSSDDNKSLPAIERDIALKKTLQPWIFFPSQSVDTKSQSFITSELPENVHLLTLDTWDDSKSQILIRLEHILEWNEDNNLSKEVTVDLNGLFKQFTITSLEETLLAGTVSLSESERLKWPQVEESFKSEIYKKETRLQRRAADLNITLAPMQIRTFIATIERN